ncbi:MAG: triose-phosphate isomerase [Puniceicoccales bacterium]|jgi:triosephosphate isomerase|nr:triose-phosphate isomerase [Puniceicoccales bacterium]
MLKNRRYLIAGNWKMNISSSDAGQLIADIAKKIKKISAVDILICPPFTSIPEVKKSLSTLAGVGSVFLGAQNFYPGKSGAYTGEISAVMLRELGVSHVIIGHSERRTLFGENDALINQKVLWALGSSLIPILCVGETIEERKNDNELEVIAGQLKNGLQAISQTEAKKLVLAYEPVWAIGTGETATPKIAQKMHLFIRENLREMFGAKTAAAIKILYGGSMKADNGKDLLAENDIDGGLIGGASLQASSFVKIIEIADDLSGDRIR